MSECDKWRKIKQDRAIGRNSKGRQLARCQLSSQEGLLKRGHGSKICNMLGVDPVTVGEDVLCAGKIACAKALKQGAITSVSYLNERQDSTFSLAQC